MSLGRRLHGTVTVGVTTSNLSSNGSGNSDGGVDILGKIDDGQVRIICICDTNSDDLVWSHASIRDSSVLAMNLLLEALSKRRLRNVSIFDLPLG